MNKNKDILIGVGLLAVIVVGVVLLVVFNRAPAAPGGAGTLTTTIAADDHIKGQPNGQLVLVEYSDFQCPACASYYPVIKRLVTDFGDRLTFVYRHFPLSQHLQARLAARAAEAAGRQNKFWEMHDLLFTGQNNWADAGGAEDIMLGYAEELGLDMEQFRRDLNDDVLTERVRRDTRSGEAAGINSTPTFFLNGRQITNPRGYDEFRTIIERELSAAS